MLQTMHTEAASAGRVLLHLDVCSGSSRDWGATKERSDASHEGVIRAHVLKDCKAAGAVDRQVSHHRAVAVVHLEANCSVIASGLAESHNALVNARITQHT